MGSSIVLQLYKVIWGSRILIDHFMELDEECATMVSIFQCIYFCIKILAEAFRRYKTYCHYRYRRSICLPSHPYMRTLP